MDAHSKVHPHGRLENNFKVRSSMALKSLALALYAWPTIWLAILYIVRRNASGILSNLCGFTEILIDRT